jgi:UDP-N-acetyl-D-glucosamine dehydrogenase
MMSPRPAQEQLSTSATLLAERFRRRDATVGVVGLGYAGLPIANLLGARGFRVLGFDTDESRIEMLNAGKSYIQHLRVNELRTSHAEGRFIATGDFRRLDEADALLVCVPTPLDRHREPDTSFVAAAAARIAARLRPGMLVVLESTTYPGTCRDIVRPVLERSGLRCGEDFFLAYSPEREDPGNSLHTTATIPRVVGGDGRRALELACALYGELVADVVPVGSIEIAEAVKLTENIFRSVNIALVNELKTIYDAMGIDVWHVIAGASTKPFGYMPFHPGPGLGGHCVPIDPFYLAWKAREYGVNSRLIELAGEINSDMPRLVLGKLARAVDRMHGRGLRESRILILGVAYKPNIGDVRESPALRLMELLDDAGALVDYHDPFVPELPETNQHKRRISTPWPSDGGQGYHAAVIVTDHGQIDYADLVDGCPLVLDTRNACESRGILAANIIKA